MRSKKKSETHMLVEFSSLEEECICIDFMRTVAELLGSYFIDWEVHHTDGTVDETQLIVRYITHEQWKKELEKYSL